jgi:SAP domain-containing ribonucleoprotein
MRRYFINLRSTNQLESQNWYSNRDRNKTIQNAAHSHFIILLNAFRNSVQYYFHPFAQAILTSLSNHWKETTTDTAEYLPELIMANDYSRKKNAELEELLKARSLPHTGKKAELVARLQEDDAKRASSTSTAGPVAPALKSITTKKTAPAASPVTEDVIDWDDETNSALATPINTTAASKPPPAPTTAAKNKPAETAVPPAVHSPRKAAGAGAAPTPVAIPNQVAAFDPAKTHDLTVSAPAPKTTPASPSKPKPASTPAPAAATETFTSNLPSTDFNAELAKRAARAARFGTANTGTNGPDGDGAADAERQKALERAKKFGTVEGDSIIAALDRALPDRGTKRGRGAEEGGGRSESKRGRRERSGQRGRGAPRDGSKTGAGRKRGEGRRTEPGKSAERITNANANANTNAKTNAQANTRSNPTTNKTANPSADKREKDRQAAEARKKRFAAPIATAVS